MVGSRCVVPGCSNGYNPNVQISLFGVPTNAARMVEWQKTIQGHVLKRGQRICEIHFEERFKLWTYEHTINGQRVSILRDKPSLTPDAIPSIFPNLRKCRPKMKSLCKTSSRKSVRTSIKLTDTSKSTRQSNERVKVELQHRTCSEDSISSKDIATTKKQMLCNKQLVERYRFEIKSLHKRLQTLSKSNSELIKKVRAMESAFGELPKQTHRKTVACTKHTTANLRNGVRTKV